MKNKLVWIMASAPHGNANAREGLDALLAASAVSDELVVYFDGDGVWQLLKNQQPQGILQRHVLPTYGMLELYDVEEIYVNPQALSERGLALDDLAIAVQAMPSAQFYAQLAQAHAVLRF